jgi:hypothetical protein
MRAMRRSRQAVAMAIGILLVAQPHAAVTSDKPKYDADERGVRVWIFKTGSGCDHDVLFQFGDEKVKLKKKHDKVLWDIFNNCGQPQDVLLCVYRLVPETPPVFTLDNPFDTCKDDGNIGVPFTVPSYAGVRVKCKAADHVGHYMKHILIGDDITGPTCPAVMPTPRPTPTPSPGTISIRAHALDIEITP